MIYLTNTTIIPNNGLFECRDTSLKEVIEILDTDQDYISAIGHASTAEIISSLIGKFIPINRISIQLEPGDIMIAFKLNSRPEEGLILNSEEIQKIGFSWKLIRREN